LQGQTALHETVQTGVGKKIELLLCVGSAADRNRAARSASL
jgi:hypothetical protein